MNDLFKTPLSFAEFFSSSKVMTAVWFILTLLAIYVFFKFLNIFVGRITKKYLPLQMQYVIRKIIHYTAIVVMFMTFFNRLGINLNAILGAAGIAGVAIGFAAQTSVSNIISGLFVMTERAFKIGDYIQVDSVFGTVSSIDLLSVTLVTPNNEFIRVPNETIIKANLINNTYFLKRRAVIKSSVSHGTNLHMVEQALLEIGKKNEFFIEDPPPSVFWDEITTSGVNFSLRVWCDSSNYISMLKLLTMEVYEGLAQRGIKVPFPQMDIHIVPPNEDEAENVDEILIVKQLDNDSTETVR